MHVSDIIYLPKFVKRTTFGAKRIILQHLDRIADAYWPSATAFRGLGEAPKRTGRWELKTIFRIGCGSGRSQRLPPGERACHLGVPLPPHRRSTRTTRPPPLSPPTLYAPPSSAAPPLGWIPATGGGATAGSPRCTRGGVVRRATPSRYRSASARHPLSVRGSGCGPLGGGGGVSTAAAACALAVGEALAKKKQHGTKTARPRRPR